MHLSYIKCQRQYALLSLLILLSRFSAHSQSVFDKLTYEEKVQGVSVLWKEASYNFVYFDKAKINWDSAYYAYLPKAIAAKNVYEYYVVLEDFLSLLKDGHTQVRLTDYYWKEVGPPPFVLRQVGDARLVSLIDERLINEIPLGTEVVAVNGIPINKFLEKRTSWRGIKGSKMNFIFKRADGKVFSKVITRVAGKDDINYLPISQTENFESRLLGNGIFYVRINTFGDSTVVSEFEKLIPQIQKSKGLIIDIRQNGGGNGDYAQKIAEHLVDKNYMVGSAWRARIHHSLNKAYGSMVVSGVNNQYTRTNKDYWENNTWDIHNGDTIQIAKSVEKINKHIAILIGPKTGSAAEDFLIFLDGSRNIKLIGESTAGSSGQPLNVKLPRGFTAIICAKRDTYPDGRDFINIGIQPNVKITPTPEEINNNIDSVFDYALDYLKSLK